MKLVKYESRGLGHAYTVTHTDRQTDRQINSQTDKEFTRIYSL